jgi:hypothetical protein
MFQPVKICEFCTVTPVLSVYSHPPTVLSSAGAAEYTVKLAGIDVVRIRWERLHAQDLGNPCSPV